MDALVARALLQALSGLVLSVVGAWVLAAAPRARAASAFGLFLLLWGASIAAANLDAIGAGSLAGAVELPLLMLSALALGSFLLAWAGSRARASGRALLAAATVLVAVVSLAEALVPSLFEAPLGALAGTSYPSRATALALATTSLPFELTLAAATALFARSAARATRPVEARQALVVAIGFGSFVAYGVTWNALRLVAAIEVYVAERGPLAVAVQVAMGLASLASLAVLAQAALSRRSLLARRERALLAGVPAVALLAGAWAGAAALQGIPGVRTLGVWRALLAGTVTLGLTRHGLLDAPRAPRGAHVVSSFVLAALALLFFEQIARVVFDTTTLASPPVALAAGALAAAAALVPWLPRSALLARRALSGLVDPAPRSRAGQIERYREALEARIREGLPARGDEPELRALQDALGLDERDHDLLALLAERERAGQSRAPAPVAGDRILGDTYVVESEIGRGASARVYLCRDAAGRVAAVKILPPLLAREGEAGARAAREAALLDRLRSPNVVRIVEVADRADGFFVVTEYAEGGTLESRLSRGGVLRAEAIALARDILAGLAAAHRAGVAHGDVKPANVLLDELGRAKVADFDAAFDAGTWGSVPRGTIAWMSPERFRGEPPSFASDVYAAGVILYRLVVGRHYLALDGLSFEEARVLVERAEAHFPTGLAPELRAFLERALAKDPAARYRDAVEALEALDRVAT